MLAVIFVHTYSISEVDLLLFITKSSRVLQDGVVFFRIVIITFNANNNI